MNEETKKTILLFSAFYAPFEGGAETYVREVTSRLKGRYHFIILTSRLSRSLASKEQLPGITIIRLGFGFKLDKFLYPLLAPFKAFLIKKEVVHGVLESYAGLALLIYKLLGGRTKSLFVLQSGRVRMSQFLFKKIHQAPDKIQAISASLAQRAKSFGAKDVEVVANGINLKALEAIAGEKEKGRIVCLAHLKKVKGINYLIVSMPLILEKFPSAKLVLIGEGRERQSLEVLVKSLGLEGQVEFKGKLPHQQAMEELARAWSPSVLTLRTELKLSTVISGSR